MKFIVIFIIFFSWAVNLSAHIYKYNQDEFEQFLKFRPIAKAPSFNVKAWPSKHTNNSIQEQVSYSPQVMNEKSKLINEKDNDFNDNKHNFKKFGSGKTVRKEVENKKILTVEKENICEVQDLKEQTISAVNGFDDHKNIPASTNKLASPVRFSIKTKKPTYKKFFAQKEIIQTNHVVLPPEKLTKQSEKSVKLSEKKHTKRKLDADKKMKSNSFVDFSKTKKLNADQVMNEKVSIEIPSGDIYNIVTKLMPSNWRVMMSVKDNKLKNKKFYFVSTKTRAEALNDLSGSIGVKFLYFFDLKDENKNMSPLLIVSDN